MIKRSSLHLNSAIFARQDMITSQSCQMTVMDWGCNLVGASPSSAPSVFSYSSSSWHQMRNAYVPISPISTGSASAIVPFSKYANNAPVYIRVKLVVDF